MSSCCSCNDDSCTIHEVRLNTAACPVGTWLPPLDENIGDNADGVTIGKPTATILDEAVFVEVTRAGDENIEVDVDVRLHPDCISSTEADWFQKRCRMSTGTGWSSSGVGSRGYCNASVASDSPSRDMSYFSSKVEKNQERSFSWKTHLSWKTRYEEAHPLTLHKQLLRCVKFVYNDVFATLSTPLPRCQDLPDDAFGIPLRATDLVIATSHAWRNQVHPDVHGTKMLTIQRLLDDAGIHADEDQQVFHFFDFISISQKPFRHGQVDRTSEEMASFQAALQVMHKVYFLADHIVHLSSEQQSLQGEGETFSVSARDIQKARFMHVGDWVQIAPTHVDDDQVAHCKKHEWGAFDRVEMIGTERVTTVQQLQERLEACDLDSTPVTLQRYPMGMVNNIPADDRGWVFLERFITMVKCAMLSKERARHVVLTDSFLIWEQIEDGANRLREAASGANKLEDSPLHGVLMDFVAEMATKSFSASSTDKLNIESNARKSICEEPADSEVVASIMKEFVEHLSTHWSKEASRQYQRAKFHNRMLRQAKSFIIEWDRFSPEYESRLHRASTVDTFSFLVLMCMMFIPMVVGLSFVAWPHGRPDNGLPNNVAFWLARTWSDALMFMFVPCWWFASVEKQVEQLHLSRISFSKKLQAQGSLEFLKEAGFCSKNSKALLWVCMCVVISQGVLLCLASTSNLFPFPLTIYVTVVVASLLWPTAWWLLPSLSRKLTGAREHAIYSGFIWVCYTIIFGAVYPLIWALVRIWHPASAVFFFLSRFLFEGLLSSFARRLGADIMPLAVFFGVSTYEVATTKVAVKCYHTEQYVLFWLLASAAVLVDLLEHLYYVWWLHKSDADLQSQKLRIHVLLMVRELAKVMTPLWYGVIQMGAYILQPSFNETVSYMDHDSFRTGTNIVLARFGIQLGICILTQLCLRRIGKASKELFCGVVKTKYKDFLCAMNCIGLFMLALQHSHWGSHALYGLPKSDEQTKWLHGLTWEHHCNGNGTGC